MDEQKGMHACGHGKRRHPLTQAEIPPGGDSVHYLNSGLLFHQVEPPVWAAPVVTSSVQLLAA